MMDAHTDLNFTSIEPLVSPQDLIKQVPLAPLQQAFVSSARQQVRNILDGSDSRLLLIVGPCSVHDTTAAYEYATNLKELATQVQDQFMVLMRVHCEKPRTTVGWKGLLYDPHLDGSSDLMEGLLRTRKFMRQLLELGVPVATEFLDPASPHYLADMTCWAQIGARTSASQIHRQAGSALAMPVGFKNATDGDIGIAVSAAISASLPHTYIGMDMEGRLARVTSKGNSFSHIILRGGDLGVNYHSEAVGDAVEQLQEHQIGRRLIIDCSHDNCRRDHLQQMVVFHNILQQILDGQSAICGAILESYLEEGKQRHDMRPEKIRPRVSLTDPCLDWETTERMILEAHERLQKTPSKARTTYGRRSEKVEASLS